MLKKITIAFIVLFASSFSVQAADFKIGVVNIEEVVKKLKAVKPVSDADQASLNQHSEQIKALQKKGTDLQEKAKRDEMTLTNEQKRDINRQLLEIESEIKLKTSFFKDDLALAQKRQQSVISQKILQAIGSIAEKENFDLVIRSEGTFYAKKGINITDKVAAILNDPAG